VIEETLRTVGLIKKEGKEKTGNSLCVYLPRENTYSPKVR